MEGSFTTGIVLMKIFAFPFLFVFAFSMPGGRAFAGDAVMWDSVGRHFVAEYSSTPIGGKDYLTGEQAMESVQKAMRKQGVIDPVAVWKSDRTGYFAVCSAFNAKKETVVGVGVGATEAESKVHGVEQLRKAGAVTGLFIAHRYESSGKDSPPDAPPLIDLNTSPVENEEISSLSPDGRFALSTAHSRGWKLQRLDLVDLQSFDLLLELGTPTTLYGSDLLVGGWGKRFAFFGEERAWGDTSVYFVEEGKYKPVALPRCAISAFPDPELELKPDEHVFKDDPSTMRVRPKRLVEIGRPRNRARGWR